MGKDKGLKAPQTETKAEEKKPIARGHKQRGAGTVITARPNIVTNDGVTLKAHERLPSVLLNEYCQKEKRPKPRYEANPPGHRMTVILEDGKNSKNDLSFSPIQNFETETLARDFAALLALFHFQKALPLERKLPEPFSTTWIEMLNASKGPTGANAGSSTGNQASIITKSSAKDATQPSTNVQTKESPKVAAPDSEFKGKSKIHGNFVCKQETAPKEDLQAQWLCDNCGNANFATTAAGLLRTKCFKCQTPKPEKFSTVTKSTAINQKTFKAPPKAVLDLRAQNAHASLAEIERKDMEERAAKNRRLTYFDALKRANRPKPIHLKPTIREQLEKLFGIEHVTDCSTSIRGLEEYLEDVLEEGIIPLDICSVNYREQADLLQSVCLDLSDKGCSDKAVVLAVKNAVINRNDELVEDFAVRYDTIEVENTSIVEKSRFVLEKLLREILDTSVYAKISVVGPNSLSCSKASKLGNDLGFPETVVTVLESLGWRQDSIMLACLQISIHHKLIGTLPELQLEEYLPLLVHSFVLITSTKAKSPIVNFFRQITFRLNCSTSAVEEEKETICSILGEKCDSRHITIADTTFQKIIISNISLQDCLKFQHSIDIEFVFHNGLDYPDRNIPLVILKNSTSDRRTDSRLIALNILAQDLANNALGSMIIFEVYSMIMDFQDNDRLFEVLKTTKFSKDIIEIFIEYYDCQENILEQDITSKLSKVNNQLISNELDDNNSDMSDYTESESISTATKSASNNHQNRTRLHPFWSRPPNGKGCNGFDTCSQQYQEMFETRSKLPSFQMKNEFLSLLSSNRVIIVTGETGCGKTTQIPQFIHEQNQELKILICQPRRLAAVGVASRVAEEQACSIGDRVGYMVKGDSKVSVNTRIMFCTYGVLLRRLQDDAEIRGVDYVVFDEVHERGIDSDFCLALMMEALEKRNSLKLILMSATISTEHFRSYIKQQLKVDSLPPLLHIPGFTHPVQEIYKGDFEDLVRAYPLINDAPNSSEDDEDYMGNACHKSNSIGGFRGGNLKRKDVDYDLLVKLVFYLIKGSAPIQDASQRPLFRAASGCILIFLPGVPEINRFLDFFRQYWKPDPNCPKTNLIALHGNVPPQEQKKVFQLASRGTIKIVAATNVAEASVTIPDVTVVVDTCRVKEMGYDPETQAYGLTLKFAAKDSLRQRKGRAGRVQEGRCFRLITSGTFEKLPAHSIPEILRLPLESVLLQVWAMKSVQRGSREISNVPEVSIKLLNRCPDAPSAASIQSAQEVLTGLQAINRETCQLTNLGWHLSRLPCTPRVGRLLVYGCLLNCIFPVACVAATMTLRSPFVTSPDAETVNKVQAAKEKFSTGGLSSDYNIIVKAMIAFQTCQDQRKFCREHGLAYERMQEIRQSMREFMEDLVDIGLLSTVKNGMDLNNPITNGNSYRINLLAATYCAGLYPQVAKVIRPPKRFMEVMGAAVERDTDAKEMKLYVPRVSTSTDSDPFKSPVGINFPRHANADFDISTEDLQRVYVHPTSINFQNNAFKASNYILYGEKQVVQSNFVNEKAGPSSSQIDLTKIYLRDTSEVTAYSLLFFGGDLEYNHDAGVIVVDNWISFACSERISELVKRIRLEFEKVLASKIENPQKDLTTNTLLNIVCELLDSSEEENR